MRRGFATAAVTVVCAAACPAIAAADTTVDFDGFAAGTTITDQYANAGGAGNGVVFGPLPGGSFGFNPVVRTPPAGQAQSGANVADIVTCPSGTTDCEFVTPHTTGTFAVPRSHVAVDVGYLGSGSSCVVPSDNGCAVVTLIAYDASGSQIAASPPTLVKQGAGVHTPLSVTTPSPRIVGFQVTARTDSSDYDKLVAIDDLTFDTPTTPPTPDFTLTPQATFVNVVQGSSITDGITIGRIGGSSGNVALAVSGTLPTGVHAQNAPNPATGSSSTLTLTADPTAPPTLGAPRTITVGGTCPQKYDAEVFSMQVTQGTQLPVLPQRDPGNPAAAVPYAAIGQAAAPGTMQELAKLAAFKPTSVRVYADLRYGPGFAIQVPAVLNGFRYDSSGQLVPLLGSPIMPISSPAKLITGTDQLPGDLLQDNHFGVYTFALPASWERGKVKLEAQLLPAQTGQGSAWAPCTTAACQIHSTFAISQIPFLYTFGVTIRPVALIRTNPYDATLPDPVSVFRWASVVTPVPLTIEPYATTIDIGDDIATGGDDATLRVLNKLGDYVCDNGSPAHGWDVGIEHDGIRSAQRNGYCVNILPPGVAFAPFAFVSAPSPLRSVAHELFHLFGRPHASPGCGSTVAVGGEGAVPAEDWPSDQQGFLQSVGLAPVPDSSGFPDTVVPISDSTSAGQFFDFMSYCAHGGAGDPFGANQDTWISVHNWNAILASFGYGPARDAGGGAGSGRGGGGGGPMHHASGAATRVPSLHVSAQVAPGGRVTIVGVSQVHAPPQPASNSPFRLVATDSRGHTLADVPMHMDFGHADSSPPTPILTLDAVVPSTDVASVGVLAGGTAVARRTRSAHRPTVSLPGVPSFGKRYALVRWRATDRDHDPLSVEVDYSGDGGRAWTRVWLGPNRGRARLPARYLFRSRRARVRVSASDGFRSTTASSRPFSSPGGAPIVQILAPWTGVRRPNDAPLVLSGQAFDDRSHLLTGHRLRWLVGRRVLGTGPRITVSGLPAGRHRIVLLARDRFGRRGVASVVVVLRGSRPLFLTLQAPRTLRRTARTLRLTVAVSLPATLVTRSGGLRPQRFAVGRRPRRLRVHVRPGHAPLTVRLSLRAGGLSGTETISIPRS